MKIVLIGLVILVVGISIELGILKLNQKTYTIDSTQTEWAQAHNARLFDSTRDRVNEAGGKAYVRIENRDSVELHKHFYRLPDGTIRERFYFPVNK